MHIPDDEPPRTLPRAELLERSLGLEVSASFLRLLDAWRVCDPGELTQIEAIRQLAAKARLRGAPKPQG